MNDLRVDIRDLICQNGILCFPEEFEEWMEIEMNANGLHWVSVLMTDSVN